MERLRDYQKARHFIENHDWRNDPTAKDNLTIINYALQKVSDYEDLEEQGRLLKPPCALGDTVYRIYRATESSPDIIYECKVVGIKYENNTYAVKLFAMCKVIGIGQENKTLSDELYANILERTYSIWIEDWFETCQMDNDFFGTQEAAVAALS